MHRDDAVEGEMPRVSMAPVFDGSPLSPSRGEANIRGARQPDARTDERLDRLFHSALLSLLGKSAVISSLPSGMEHQQNRSEMVAMTEQTNWESEAKRL